MPAPPVPGLHSPDFERDSCGFGLIAQLDDRPSRALVDAGLQALARLVHRGAVGADGGGAFEGANQLSAIRSAGDDQALQDMGGTIVDIYQPAQVRCQAGVQRQAILPQPQHGKDRVPHLHPQARFLAAVAQTGSLQPIADFLGQKFQHDVTLSPKTKSGSDVPEINITSD